MTDFSAKKPPMPAPSSRIKQGLKRVLSQDYRAVYAEAIDAIKNDPADAGAYFLLGVIAFEHQNYPKAATLFERAEQLNQDQAYYPAYLAKTLSAMRQQERACSAAERASALNTNDPHLLDTLGVVLSRAGSHQKALELFERAVERKSDNAEQHYNLGASAQFIGDFARAETAYKAALALNPMFDKAWSSLVYLRKQTSDNHSLTQLKALFSANAQNSDARLRLGHAIAKTYEDLNKHPKSLEWLHKAKAQKSAEFPYDRSASQATFDAAKQTSERALGAPLTQTAQSQRTPIFVVGLPRTGTTLVDRILSSHTQVESAGELNTFAQLIKETAATESNLILDAPTLNQAHQHPLLDCGQAYLDQTAHFYGSSGGAGRYLVDKMPLNFFYAGLILRALPHARVIALRRNPLDSCMANYRQLFATQQSFYNYTFDLNDTAWFYRQFNDLMAHFKTTLPANRFTEIAYEDIVFNQVKSTRALLDFCELEWQDACLSFHENTAPVSTASSVQVRQPLYSSSIDRYKRYGTHLDALREQLSDLLDH